VSSYADFAEKLLIAVYQETERTGAPYQRVGPLLAKYGIDYKALWISQVADEWEHLYFKDVSRVLNGYEHWSFRISAQGVREIEEKYGDKDGVGEILVPVDEDRRQSAAETVPASDRMVRLSDNYEGAVSARAAVSDLSAALHQANDIGDLSSEEIEEAKREVWLIDQIVNQESVRIDWIESVAKACLQWIAVKAAEQVVGSLALAALTALALLFGFSI
jgi:hypothetical protein